MKAPWGAGLNAIRKLVGFPPLPLRFGTLEHFKAVSEAKDACYWRLHPEPHIDTSRGARILYDAVCELWRHSVETIQPEVR